MNSVDQFLNWFFGNIIRAILVVVALAIILWLVMIAFNTVHVIKNRDEIFIKPDYNAMDREIEQTHRRDPNWPKDSRGNPLP